MNERARTLAHCVIKERCVSGYPSAMRDYVNFSGRTSRDDYWRAQQVFIPLIVLAFAGLGLPFLHTTSIWPTLLFLLIVGPHAVPWTALMIRRLHDMDRSGWWALAALMPIYIIMPWGLLFLLVFGGRPGTRGPNRFGPDPLDRENAAAAAKAAAGSRVTAAHMSRAPTPVPASPSIDVVAELERLARLKAAGAISEDEFNQMKARALSQVRGA